MKKKEIKKEEKITNEELLESINRSFSKVEGKIDTIDIKVEELKKEVKGVKNQLEGTNKRIDDISLNRVKYEDFNKLKIRVERLETKVK